MVFSDAIKNSVMTIVMTATAMVIIIFDFLLNRGFVQTKGSMNGPMQRKEATSDQVLKYHFGFS
ncbi:MAG: hypothetical protein KKC39_06945 [Candidatus Omnitrophica bacterium]|nr:hypothetical protein [Candidatus Omnitrophota bacterium]MBU4468456.1 hypothetical protein [Candidatus Omnitrophota bacterium]MCG2708448.1 hypothetical protein [Candidatus Omnitrophota bacterium]